MSNLHEKTSDESSNANILIPAIIGFGFNLILAIIIIHLFLTPQIYMQSPLNPKALSFGLIGAVIPLSIVFIGIKAGKIDFPINSNTDGLIQLVQKPWGPVVVSIGAGISEELLFRGAIFELLFRYFGSISSVLIISILFMVIHLPQYKKSPFLNVVMFLLSIVFTVIYIQSGSIWAPIVAHAVYNFVICIWIKFGFLPLNPIDDLMRKSEQNV